MITLLFTKKCIVFVFSEMLMKCHFEDAIVPL